MSKRARARPALSKAIAYVEHAVGKCAQAGESRLKPVHTLAERAGVSHVTMWKALRSLSHRGLVDLKPGRGIHIRQKDKRTEALPVSTIVDSAVTPKWEIVRSALEREIATGTYSAGSMLPSLKELASHHGTAYRTLRKALNALTATKRIVPHKRGYRVPQLAVSQPAGSVAFLTIGDLEGRPHFWSPNQEEDYRWLERECSRRRIHLELLTFDYVNRTVHFRGQEPPCPVERLRDRSSRLGYLLWLQNFYDTQVRWVFDTTFGFDKPFAISARLSAFQRHLHGRKLARKRLFVSPDSGYRAGQLVGRYLLELGHTSLGAIFPYTSEEWSRLRAEGIRDAFACAGHGAKAYFFAPDAPLQPQPPPRDEIEAVLPRLLPPADSEADRPQSERHVLQALTEMHEPIARHINRTMVFHDLQPLLRRALKTPNITVWVAATDGVAIECLRFLRRSKVQVPGDISLVGFDDSVEASVRELTSYNFNGQAVLSAMLNFVLNPGMWTSPSKTAHAPLLEEIDGFVTERQSVRRFTGGRGRRT